MERLNKWLLGVRLKASLNLISFGIRALPESPYKNMVTFAFYDVNASICEQSGQLERARQIRHSIAHLRVGGRKADRSRQRRRI